MKKFLLTSCAILSAIGVQAKIEFTEGYVTYEASLDSSKYVSHADTTKELYSEDVRTAAKAIFSMDIHTITTTTKYYDVTAVEIDDVASVNLYNFNKYTAGNKSEYTGSFSVPETYYEVGSNEYTTYFQYIKNKGMLGEDIKSYADMAEEMNISAYYYWTYDAALQEWNKIATTDVTNDNLNRNGYYKKWTNTSTNNSYYFLIQNLGVCKRYATTDHTKDTCIVVAVDDAARRNSTIESISLGKNITTIEEGSFSKAYKLSNFSVQRGGHFIFENGILYNSDKTAIVVAGINTTSQTIPSSVDYIYDDAFYNITNNIVITSLNNSLDINGNATSYVTFLKPSATLTKTMAANGGYTVSGQVTQSNISALTIEGTYIDFRNSNVLEDIDITNVGNTLLYFATDKNVTGNKNIINNNVCANCVITDNASDKFYCPSKFTATNLSYSRQFDALWRTATFPFSTNDATVNDQILTGEFRGYMEDMHLFNFVYSQSIVANRPYIIKTESDDENASFRFENLSDVTVEVTNPMQVKQGTNENPAYFYGNFDTKTLTSTDVTFYYGITNTLNPQTGKYRNEVVKCVGATIKPFRAYLSGPATSTANSARIRLVDAMDQVIDEIEMPMTTGIEDIKTEEAITNNVYNLNGQSVKASRGLNIINGKVVINK